MRGVRSERLEVRCYRAGPRLSADLHPLHPHRHRGALQRSPAHPRHMRSCVVTSCGHMRSYVVI